MLSRFIERKTKGAISGVLLVMMLILPGVTFGVDAPKVAVLTPWSKGMAFPARLAMDAAGNSYVGDSLAHSVQIFTPSGKYRGSFGSYGTASGQFSSPTGIAYEKISNQLVVADSLNRRVQFFDTLGMHRKTLGGSTSSPVQFTSPQGIAFEYSGDGCREQRRVDRRVAARL